MCQKKDGQECEKEHRFQADADEHAAELNRREAESRPKERDALTCSEIAARIDAHLRRFEADPKINQPLRTQPNLSRFWRAGAGANGSWVHVTYVGYQGSTALSKRVAANYLAWLDAGNVGQHYQASDWALR